MRHRFTSAAFNELRHALRYYEEAQPGLGTSFLDEIEAAIRRISAHPEAWQPLSKRSRRCRVKRFPFGVIYQIRATEILVLGVLDLRTDPRSWQHLL